MSAAVARQREQRLDGGETWRHGRARYSPTRLAPAVRSRRSSRVSVRHLRPLPPVGSGPHVGGPGRRAPPRDTQAPLPAGATRSV
jgi:hypothetical protein